jgi:hypothetical protein
VFEAGRAGAAQTMGFVVDETWWHRDLSDLVEPSVGFGDMSVGGAVGLLVPAPPVYDPGGPVLHVARVDDEASLARVEARGARCGATVSVVSQSPRDDRLAHILQTHGYTRTTDFYASI